MQVPFIAIVFLKGCVSLLIISFVPLKCVKFFSGFAAVLPYYFDQLKCVPNRGEFSVISSVGRGNLGNNSRPRSNFDRVLCIKI